ncbi:tripartite tricarboxylate transporter substrate binding protein [Roseomonas sp. OT10]|uniref:Bug family tripartite tricarboxylate transporter substrate binding protein n=1 Tax=Roseomonas cutis TaxID=2897332 RepID=UPI001E2AED08|nr:tripartite tricarboxylate transporter substrate binding protein [Roseomonas sp. OT10]UFN49963.1 tripartite tricarboxylate transporter substrate binding protein [Roseomonas sp. OT10]
MTDASTTPGRLPRRGLLLAGGGLLAAPALHAQPAWPTRPIRMVVPFATGGGTDVTMRLLGPKLGEILGQPVVIENRPGGGSTVGTDYVAKSAPDGSTFVLATLSSTGVAKGLYANLSYDPVKDLTAIAPTVFIPICLGVTTKGIDARDAAAFIALLKANPNRFQYGSSGVGSTGHIANANFLRATGTQAEHVPYRGGGQVFSALLAGEIQFTHDIPSLLKPYHDAGQARVLFIAADRRSTLLPDVPTLAEAGVPDYKAYSWYGIFGPAGTPRPIVERMAAAIEQALNDPTIKARLDELGTPAMTGYTPDRFARYVAEEIDTWVPLVRASGARVE